MGKFHLVAIETPDKQAVSPVLDTIKLAGSESKRFRVVNAFRIHAKDEQAFLSEYPDMFLIQALAIRTWDTLQDKGLAWDGEKGFGMEEIYAAVAKRLNTDEGLHQALDYTAEQIKRELQEAKGNG